MFDARHGRTSLFPSRFDFDRELSGFEAGRFFRSARFSELHFEIVKEDHLLVVRIDGVPGEPYVLTHHALRDVSKLLRFTPVHLAKYPATAIILNDLNNTPYRDGDELVHLECFTPPNKDTVYILGVSPVTLGWLPISTIVDAIADDPSIRDSQHFLTGEGLSGTFLAEDFQVTGDNFLFTPGIHWHMGVFNNGPFWMRPYFTVCIEKGGVPFEFDFSLSAKLLNSNHDKPDFGDKLHDFMAPERVAMVGRVAIDEAKRVVVALRDSHECSLRTLQAVKAAACGAFSSPYMPAPISLAADLVPELTTFLKINQEQIGQMSTFESASLRVNTFIPGILQAAYGRPETVEISYVGANYPLAAGRAAEAFIREAGLPLEVV